jgi:hypothetical protein
MECTECCMVAMLPLEIVRPRYYCMYILDQMDRMTSILHVLLDHLDVGMDSRLRPTPLILSARLVRILDT